MKHCSKWLFLISGLLFFAGLQTNALAAASGSGPLQLIVSSLANELTPTTTSTTASLETTTTTTAAANTTTTTAAGSTTTTSVSGGCPAKTVLGERLHDLNRLRALRNDILLKSPAGQLYTALYYRHAFEVRDIFAHNEELREKANLLVQGIMPAVGSLLDKAEAVIDEESVQESIALIDALTEQASPALVQDLNRLKQDIQNGVIFNTVGMKIQKK